MVVEREDGVFLMRGSAFNDTDLLDQSHRQWKRILFGKWGERLLLGLTFVISIAAFLHWSEEHVDVLQLHSKAKRYVIAQVDFDFLDLEAMNILKQEEVRDIGKIYRFDLDQVNRVGMEFEHFLRENALWREQSQFLTFEELKRAQNILDHVLSKIRLSDARTVQKVCSLGLTQKYYAIFSPRDIHLPLAVPCEVWHTVRGLLEQKGDFHSDDSGFIIDYFRAHRWDLQPDLSRQSELRQIVEENIPHVYTHIPAGSRIIDAQDKVTSRHLAMMAGMKRALSKARNFWDPWVVIGNLLLSSLFALLGIVYFSVKHRDVLESCRKLVLLITVLLLTLILGKITTEVIIVHLSQFVEIVHYPLFVPFASLLVSLFFGARMAIFTTGFLILLFSLSFDFNAKHFLVINLFASLIAIICSRSINRRNEVFSVCGKVWLGSLPVMIAFNLIENTFWQQTMVIDVATTFIFMLLIAIFVVGLLPILEASFGLMTDMSISEFIDPNHEILRRLSLELPGTYQHSLVVGNLSEIAAQKIGANGFFCRVASLYHDIGKLSNPHYFGENQLGGFNIHQLLTPEESAQVIINHVKEGEKLARKHHLPESFIDIIRQHHGTTLVWYFYSMYNKQLNVDSEIDQTLFRYPGPIPQSKESAIIMIADSVEAASRSLEDVSEETLSEMVKKIIADKASDRQFDECPLTFAELTKIKRSMIKTLRIAHHLRVKYPVEQKEVATQQV